MATASSVKALGNAAFGQIRIDQRPDPERRQPNCRDGSRRQRRQGRGALPSGKRPGRLIGSAARGGDAPEHGGQVGWVAEPGDRLRLGGGPSRAVPGEPLGALDEVILHLGQDARAPREIRRKLALELGQQGRDRGDAHGEPTTAPTARAKARHSRRPFRSARRPLEVSW